VKFLALAAFGWLLAGGANAAEPGPFAQPPELEADVRFWIRVYTEVNTDQGLLHDDQNLGLVYEVLRFDPGLSPALRERRVADAKARYAELLRRFAAGSTADLTAHERRILHAFGDKAAPAQFRSAAEHIRFQLGQADRFREGLVRAAVWETRIARTLGKLGVPGEIAVLPHVESSFNPAAYSKVGAAGLWQFMPSTARRYMRVDSVVDERLDPYSATEAAANLMLYNYRLLGTWPLAVTAYNHGPGGLRRAQEELGSSEIAVIVRRYQGATFGFASRNFYVAFLAALEVDRNAERFFGPITHLTDTDSTTLELPDYIPVDALAKAFKADLGALRVLNPALRPPVWSGARFVPRGYSLRLPGTVADREIAAGLARLPLRERYVAQRNDGKYRVRRGETLAAIAAGSGVSLKSLLAANGMSGSPAVQRGQVLHIPPPASRAEVGGGSVVLAAGGAGVASLGVAAGATGAPSATGLGVAAGAVVPAVPGIPFAAEYVVRPGDALSTIARRTGVSETRIKQFNDLKDTDFLYPGQRLKLAPSGGVPPMLASVEESASPVVVPDTGSSPEPARSARRSPAPMSADRQPTSPAPLSARSPVVAQVTVGPFEPVSERQAGTTALLPVAAPSGTSDTTDYSVGADSTVIVQAAETLGHFADWSGVTAADLRALNRLRKGAFVSLGRKIKLDLSRVDAARFETARRDYHRHLQEAFFAAHRIAGVESYAVKRGDSLWTIAQQRADLPVWLVTQYNPDVDFNDVHPGSTIALPKVVGVNRQ
jgi:membrane-bound lytic murein transglycosylase D